MADVVDRDRMVEENLDLARSLASRFVGRNRSFEDLEQAAALALVKAAQRFDPERGVPFRGYASATILGELRRDLRDRAWSMRVPRSLQERALEVHKAIPTLAQRLGRSPTVEELSALTGLDEDDVYEALDARDAYRLDSMDRPIGSESGSATVGDFVGVGEFAEQMSDAWLDVAEGVKHLPERQRKILYLRFWEGMTQSEIGDAIGVSQMHVSRLLRRALRALREFEEGDPTEFEFGD